MSVSVEDRSEPELATRAKRKLEEVDEIEIDVDAPEPPSKKALRKSKKAKVTASNGDVPTKDDLETKTTNTSRSGYGVWIGNLNFTTAKKDLQDFFTQPTETPIRSDQITRIHLPTGNPRHGVSQNKGFAYVDFIDQATLTAALQLSEALLTGRRVLIKNAKDFAGRPDKSQHDSKIPQGQTSRKVFVGNLPFDITADGLRAHFQAAGEIADLHMATFEDSGKCKGYAWVTFEDISSAIAVIRGWAEIGLQTDSVEENKASRKRVWFHKIEGRKLRMEYAEDSTTRYNKRFKKNADRGQGEVAQEEANADDASSRMQNGVHRRNGERQQRPAAFTTKADAGEPTRQGSSMVGVTDGNHGTVATGTKTTFD